MYRRVGVESWTQGGKEWTICELRRVGGVEEGGLRTMATWP